LRGPWLAGSQGEGHRVKLRVLRPRFTPRRFATMALSKSALSELLDALRAGGDLDVIREALALVLGALIEVEPPGTSAPAL
jgi:hypothetical protein